jgi:hypothetical protein
MIGRMDSEQQVGTLRSTNCRIMKKPPILQGFLAEQGGDSNPRYGFPQTAFPETLTSGDPLSKIP